MTPDIPGVSRASWLRTKLGSGVGPVDRRSVLVPSTNLHPGGPEAHAERTAGVGRRSVFDRAREQTFQVGGVLLRLRVLPFLKLAVPATATTHHHPVPPPPPPNPRPTGQEENQAVVMSKSARGVGGSSTPTLSDTTQVDASPKGK